MLKNKFYPAAVLFIFIMICIWCSGCSHKEKDDLETWELEEDHNVQSSNVEEPGTAGNDQMREESPQQIFVYVCGAVKTPGVYELNAGARLYEAIACAGGVREDAAEESINQAQTVSDGERLYIPTDEEVRQGLDAYLQSDIAEAGAGGTEGAGMAGAMSAGGNSVRDVGGKVNINTASREELKTLNGIGDTRAGSIIAYRESNGLFGSIEDLMKVEGIKEGVYNKLNDEITVN